jgi:hypothetical protein
VDMYVCMYKEVNVDSTVPGKQLDLFMVAVWLSYIQVFQSK